MTAEQRQTLVAALRDLGANNADPNPCNRNHSRVRLDGLAIIFEANWNAGEWDIDTVKGYLADVFGIDPATISHSTAQTVYGPAVTFSHNGDKLRVLAFGGTASTYAESHAPMLEYISANAELWRGISLPQNMLADGVTITEWENFEDASEWTVIAGATPVNDAVEFVEGTQSLKIQPTGGISNKFQKDTPFDFSRDGKVRMWVRTDAGTIGWLRLTASSTPLFGFPQASKSLGGLFVDGRWVELELTKAEIGAGVWPAVGSVRLEAFDNGDTPSYWFDSLRFGYVNTPAVVFTLDDGFASDYQYVFPYMRERGIPGTSFVNTAWVGTAGHLTVAQLQEMNAAGWDIANHTTQGSIVDLSLAEQEAALLGAANQLDAWGCTRASRCVAYPGGDYNDSILAAMANTGMVLGRSVDSKLLRNQTTNWLPAQSPFTFGCVQHLGAEAMRDWLENTIIAQTKVGILCWHQVEAVGGWKDAVDIIWEKVVSGALIPLTISQLYRVMQSDIWIHQTW